MVTTSTSLVLSRNVLMDAMQKNKTDMGTSCLRTRASRSSCDWSSGSSRTDASLFRSVGSQLVGAAAAGVSTSSSAESGAVPSSSGESEPLGLEVACRRVALRRRVGPVGGEGS